MVATTSANIEGMNSSRRFPASEDMNALHADNGGGFEDEVPGQLICQDRLDYSDSDR